MVRCLGDPVMPRPVVIRREDTANKSDDRDAKLPTVTETIDIPPAIPPLWHWALKSQSTLRQPGFSRGRGPHRQS